MKYNDLEDTLLYFNTTESDYEKYKNKSYLSEWESEQMGFISGEIHETAEILRGAFTDTKETYDNIMLFLQKHCPNSYNIIKNNLQSNPNKYTTLYDLCIEVNMKREDDIYFPTKLTKQVSIYK